MINYGRNDATTDVIDDVNDQDDLVAVAPRRSATQVRHPGAPRPSSPRRHPFPVLCVEDELPVRSAAPRQTLANGRRTVGRHYSGGHCTGSTVRAGGPLAVPNGGPPTTTTVVRRRHWSDDQRDSVVVDLPTEPESNAVLPEPATRLSDASKADAGDAESVVPAAPADPKSSSADDRRSNDFSGGSSSSADDSFRRTVDDARMPEVARRGRLFAKRYRRRLVLQSGLCNVSFANVDRRGARLLMDIFTTLLEMKWRYTASDILAQPNFEFLISQGSVATCLRCDGCCLVDFVANFIRFPAVQKF